MIVAALFALYAGVAGGLAPLVLRGGWVTRSLRLAIGLWLVLPVSWVIAVVMAVLAASAPFLLAWPEPGPGLDHVLAGPPVPGSGMITVTGLALAAAIALRAGWCLAGEWYCGWRSGRGHAALVAATGRTGPERGVVILDHDALAVYCLTSGRDRIVISAGALAALTPGQIRAVFAHERAHLRGRHHAMLTLSTGLARAFPKVPLLAQAGPQLGVLAEMAADDAAVRGHRRDDLAAALVSLAGAGPHPAALTVGGPAALARLQRLLTPPQQHHTGPARLAAIAGLLLAAAIASVPLIISVCDLATHLA